ncbi:MAG: hypothetical protein AAF206_17330 [Bacteroidota bacterium]
MKKQIEIRDDSIPVIVDNLKVIKDLPVRCFEGKLHRHMCISLVNPLWNRLKNAYRGTTAKRKISIHGHEAQIIYLALLYAKVDPAIAREVNGQVVPMLPNVSNPQTIIRK